MKKNFRRLTGLMLWACLLFAAVPALAAGVVISGQPQDASASDGETASVTVLAEGNGLQYEWWCAPAGTHVFTKDNENQTGRYEVTMDAAHHGMRVYCIVSDARGRAVRTRTATLYMMSPFQITVQPRDAYAYEGEMFTVSVEAEGERLSYAWWFADEGEDIYSKSSVETSVYSLKMTDQRANRTMYCTVTDKYGRVIKSDTVRLVMKLPLEITSQPGHASAAAGESVTFKMKASGDQVQYVWWVSDAQGVMQKTDCSKSKFTLSMDGEYGVTEVYCVATDAYGVSVQSDTVTATLIPAGLSYKIRDGAAVITGYTGDQRMLTIPSAIAGCPVRQIASKAFSKRAYPAVIVLPDTLEKASEKAFAGSKISCVVIPEGMKLPEEDWFEGQKLIRICCTADSPAEKWAREMGHEVLTAEAGDVICILLPEGEELVCLEPQMLPIEVFTLDGTAYTGRISFESSDSAVAAVDENGTVTLLDDAQAVITVTAGRVSAQCTVTGKCVNHQWEQMNTEDGLEAGNCCSVCGKMQTPAETPSAPKQ